MITGQRLLGTGLPVGLDIGSGSCRGEASALAAAAAEAQGFDDPQADRLAGVATGMAGLLARYSRSGRIFVRLLKRGEQSGVELLATDLGPVLDEIAGRDGGHGLDDEDPRGMGGYRTGRELAGGLGEIAGLSDVFDHYCTPGGGMVMMSRLWGGSPVTAADARFTIGSMIEPIAGEEVCGDAWAVEQSSTRLVALVADGLGHGHEAAAASDAAVTTFRNRHLEPVEEIAGHIHRALRGTRGAAIAVAEVDLSAGQIRFCGIGNISARLVFADRHKNLISQYGIAGYQARRIRAYDHDWGDGALLVMHSDGLFPSWDFDSCAGILRHHPQLAASTVMRDAPRATDDALVLALRDGDGMAAAPIADAH